MFVNDQLSESNVFDSNDNIIIFDFINVIINITKLKDDIDYLVWKRDMKNALKMLDF